MTNPTPHGQVPEALRLAHIFDNPLPPEWPDMAAAAAELRRQHARIAELEAQIEASSGVQALSAAPASPWSRALEIRIAQGWKLKGDRIPVLYTDTINGEGVGRDDLWLCTTKALAASPTPPAEQQAPKAAPGESLTRDQIREVFMAHGFTIKEGQTDLKQYVYDAAHALLAMGSAPQQEAQEPTEVPYQKLTNEIDLILSDPDTELSTGAKRALLWMRTWVSVPLYTAPQPAPAPLSDDIVKDAARYRWLRNESWAGYHSGDGTPKVFTLDGAGNRRDQLAEEAMDAAIDAARARRGEKT